MCRTTARRSRREVRAHLFEPFYTTSSKGTGLGLYLARELCMNNGAMLDYEYRSDSWNQTPAEASGRFVITLATRMTPEPPMPAPRILIVDDEADLRELLDITFLKMGLDSDSAANLAEARTLLAKNAYAMVLTDMRLPDGLGIDLVREVAAAYRNTPIAVITAFGSADNAVAALKAGAFDYLSKPVALDQLRVMVQSALKLAPAAASTAAPAPAAGPALRLLGESEALRHVRAQIVRLARSMAPVAITGESGTGKELAARDIHAQSARADKPFVAVNCGAIPEALMEAEFFGYRKGAFTGAADDRDGFFQAANGGTLMLDEVADLPLPMQVKLLRAIQERRVRKVGVDGRGAGGCAPDQRDPPEPGRLRRGRQVPAGPVLPAQCDRTRPAAAARAQGRHRPAGRRGAAAAVGRGADAIVAAGAAGLVRAQLSRQCARTGKYPGAGAGLCQRRHDRRAGPGAEAGGGGAGRGAGARTAGASAGDRLRRSRRRSRSSTAAGAGSCCARFAAAATRQGRAQADPGGAGADAATTAPRRPTCWA